MATDMTIHGNGLVKSGGNAMANGNELKDYSRKISRMALFMDEFALVPEKKDDIYIYVYICMYIYVYIYVYIYRMVSLIYLQDDNVIPKTFRCFQQRPPPNNHGVREKNNRHPPGTGDWPRRLRSKPEQKLRRSQIGGENCRKPWILSVFLPSQG